MGAVDIGPGVGFGARIEKNLRDFDSIGGSSLAIICDAIGGDVMHQGGAMSPRRMGANQVGISSQQTLESDEVAGYDRVGSRCEILRR